MNLKERIEELGLKLPPAPPPGGVYKPLVISGKMLYVSGHGPVRDDGSLIIGVVGKDYNMEEGYVAARQVGLTMLSTIISHLDPAYRIKRLVKTLGMVNSAADFKQHPQVINGFSDLMAEVWGEANGIGARSAVGMILPNHIAVEVESIFELE